MRLAFSLEVGDGSQTPRLRHHAIRMRLCSTKLPPLRGMDDPDMDAVVAHRGRVILAASAARDRLLCRFPGSPQIGPCASVGCRSCRSARGLRATGKKTRSRSFVGQRPEASAGRSQVRSSPATPIRTNLSISAPDAASICAWRRKLSSRPHRGCSKDASTISARWS